MFFHFLTKENMNSRSRERKFLLDEKLRVEVFKQIMCNNQRLNCKTLDEEGFFCFKTLFLNVNAEQRVIDILGDENFQVNNFN